MKILYTFIFIACIKPLILNQSVDESFTHHFLHTAVSRRGVLASTDFWKTSNGSAVLLIEMCGNESHGWHLPEIWRGIYYIPPTNKKCISKRCFLFKHDFLRGIWYTWDIIVTHGVDGIHKLDVSSSHDGHEKATALDTSHIYVNNLTWGCWKRTDGKVQWEFWVSSCPILQFIYCRNMLCCISEYTKDSMHYMFSIHLDKKNNLLAWRCNNQCPGPHWLTLSTASRSFAFFLFAPDAKGIS